MAAVAPPSQQPTPMQTDPSPTGGGLSWEGDRMFNVYIYDYCFKRGFRQTAQQLMIEAELQGNNEPPINARQGLLFEWWSVFWVLFQAKSNNSNSEDALVYIQNAQRQTNQRPPHPSSGQLPLGSQPPPQGQPQSQGQPPQSLQPQQQQQRMVNGIPTGPMPPQQQQGMPRPPSAYMANGAVGMPNGIGGMQPGHGGQPPQQMQGQQQTGPMNFVGIGGGGPQANGIGGPSQQQQHQQQQQQGPQGGPPGGQQQQQPPMQFNPMMAGQRPPMNGQQQQQLQGRGPNPNGAGPGGPFQSPTMAPSPQQQGGPSGQGQQQQPGQQQLGQPGQAPMAQLGPSPHMAPMNRVAGMLPPQQQQQQNGAGGMNPQTPQGGGPPTPGYTPGGGQQGQGGPGQGGPGGMGQQQQGQSQQGGRPPSRTNTPRGGGMMTHPNPSPSMGARQPPGGGVGPHQQQGGMGIAGMGAMGMAGVGQGGMMGLGGGGSMGSMGMGMAGMGAGGMGGIGVGGMGGGGIGGGGPMNDSNINQEIMRIPQMNLNSLQQELGFGDKDLGALSMPEKSRIVSIWRTRNVMRKDGPGQQPQPQQQQRPGGPQQQQQQPQMLRMKRNSTSPGEEHETLPRNESSPPERKRPRRSPAEQPAMPPMNYGHHPQAGQPGGPGGPQQPGPSQQQQQQQGQQQQGQQQQGQPSQPPTPQQQPGQPPGGGGGPNNPNQPPPGQGQPGQGQGQGPQQMTPQQVNNMNMMMMHQRIANGGGGPPGALGQGGPGGPGGPQQQGGAPVAGGMMGMHSNPMMTQPMHNNLYRHQHIVKPGGMNPPPTQGGTPDHSFNAGGGPGGPGPGGPPQFSATPLTRLGQTKPTLLGMLPPPSPANGPPKDGGPGKDVKRDPGGPQPPNGLSHNQDGSPRNAPPGAPGTGPQTPVPSNQSTPGPQQQQQQPGGGGGVGGPPPLPSQQNPLGGGMSMLSMPMNMSMNPSDLGMFDQGFMNMEEFDMFKPDGGDINFERDFGQWFNNPEDGSALDLK